MIKDLVADLTAVVVINDQDRRVAIHDMLYALGFGGVRAFEDSEEALNRIGAIHPDILVIGTRMEPVDGVTFTRRLRTEPGSHDPFTPVIMITSPDDRALVLEARDAGVNEFLVRPVKMNHLQARVQTVIEKPRQPVSSDDFVGPDRRRRDVPFRGPEKRDYD